MQFAVYIFTKLYESRQEAMHGQQTRLKLKSFPIWHKSKPAK